MRLKTLKHSCFPSCCNLLQTWYFGTLRLFCLVRGSQKTLGARNTSVIAQDLNLPTGTAHLPQPRIGCRQIFPHFTQCHLLPVRKTWDGCTNLDTSVTQGWWMVWWSWLSLWDLIWSTQPLHLQLAQAWWGWVTARSLRASLTIAAHPPIGSNWKHDPSKDSCSIWRWTCLELILKVMRQLVSKVIQVPLYPCPFCPSYCLPTQPDQTWQDWILLCDCEHLLLAANHHTRCSWWSRTIQCVCNVRLQFGGKWFPREPSWSLNKSE